MLKTHNASERVASYCTLSNGDPQKASALPEVRLPLRCKACRSKGLCASSLSQPASQRLPALNPDAPNLSRTHASANFSQRQARLGCREDSEADSQGKSGSVRV